MNEANSLSLNIKILAVSQLFRDSDEMTSCRRLSLKRKISLNEKSFKNHRIQEIGAFYWRIMEVRIKLKMDYCIWCKYMQIHSAFYWEIIGNSDIQEFADIKRFQNIFPQILVVYCINLYMFNKV